MLTNFMDVITEFLMNLELFGVKPFRGIATIVSSYGFWSMVIGLVIFFMIFNYFKKTGILSLFNMVFKSIVKTIKSIFKFIAWVISQTYMMILMSFDSLANNYEKAEYWGKRILTLEGIKSFDLTGSNEILIPHIKLVALTIHFARKTLRILSNVKYSASKVFAK